jgi:subtilisin-like proprotein convertase family protein
LKKVYDVASTPALATLAGRVCRGRWTLSVRDAAAQDTGTLVSWSLRLVWPQAGAVVAPAVKKAAVKKTPARKSGRSAAAGTGARVSRKSAAGGARA